MGAYRNVAIFWAVIIIGAAAGALYLQYLGPPPVAMIASGPAHVAVATPPADPVSKPAAQTIQTGPAEIVDTGNAGGGIDSDALTQVDMPRGAPISNPLPGLLTASLIDPHWQIPRIGATGLMPMQAYAASQLPPPAAALLPPDVPRVAILVAGLGDDPAVDNLAAALPPEITLGLSPYGKAAAAAAAQARGAGHETVLVLPMPGLLAGYPQRQNLSTLDWSMAQFQGYAGVTDAFSQAMGGGFLVNETAKTWLMDQIARRGLFYIEGDANAGPPAITAGRVADNVIDSADGTAAEAVALAGLITDAQSHQAALGIMLNPTPEALRALDAWAQTLVNEDVLLVPVSALVQPPDIALPINASLKQ